MPEILAAAPVVPLEDPEIIRHYHAHVYYDPATSRDRAARLRERVAAAFPEATLGRWHDAPGRAASAVDVSDRFPAHVAGVVPAVAHAQPSTA